jgi:hypothetical protein
MNTTLKILIIFLIGILVSAAFYVAVENTTLFSNISDGGGEHGERSRPEGEMGGSIGDQHNEGASLSQGLAEVSGTLAKISIITMIVLAIQFIFARFQKGKAVKNMAA